MSRHVNCIIDKHEDCHDPEACDCSCHLIMFLGEEVTVQRVVDAYRTIDRLPVEGVFINEYGCCPIVAMLLAGDMEELAEELKDIGLMTGVTILDHKKLGFKDELYCFASGFDTPDCIIYPEKMKVSRRAAILGQQVREECLGC